MREGCSTADYIEAGLDRIYADDPETRKILAKWPGLVPPPERHPILAKLLRTLVGVAIAAACIGGINLIASGLKNQSMLSLYGVLLIIGSWITARLTPNAWSCNAIGTAFFGKVRSGKETIHTKWICCLFPIIPVRSFRLYHSHLEQLTPDELEGMHLHKPLNGLGLDGESVAQTAVWSILGIIIYVVVMLAIYTGSS